MSSVEDAELAMLRFDLALKTSKRAKLAELVAELKDLDVEIEAATRRLAEAEAKAGQRS